jgi:hypothetical protein
MPFILRVLHPMTAAAGWTASSGSAVAWGGRSPSMHAHSNTSPGCVTRKLCDYQVLRRVSEAELVFASRFLFGGEAELGSDRTKSIRTSPSGSR